MATIRDVATMAGVSVATVSHVLNDSRYVAPETKERVVAAIAELDYRRDGIARSLRRSETGTIGVIISDIKNPFFSDLYKGVEDTINGLGENQNLILCNTEEDADKERKYLDVIMEKRVDGLILAPAGGNEDYLQALVKRQFPVVFVDRSLSAVRADQVVVDNRQAARELVRHLLDRGHRRIAILKATLHADSIDRRVEGYEDALRAAGLAADPCLRVDSASDIDAAYRGGLAVLDLDPRPDAVFCTNNFMTLGMVRALDARGLSCPADIALVGFDDFPWADSFRPRITAVAQPSYEMGREAALLLHARLRKQRTGPPITVTLPTTMLVRDSSG
ncbi:MAG: LacI family DNA-binding transcriptional regulator [Azospirillaceae bacterium]